ncbi:DUF3796 domain-containing protein [Virgibacillus ndiopensis]|uniref:DUF3796 domain-containing protein n=1 Tax=Virgibacillus ndiopensis TaxID=2004408 RepID=UPI000C082CC3|nr:DUF3796 domain-containing protein [Virgibacillus ndiopensis]
MSENTIDILLSLSGLLVGGIIGLIVFYINRHIGKKKNRFDERYQQINNRAKARSWDSMLIILIIAWVVAIIYEGISFSFFLVTGIYVLHNVTLIITSVYVNKQN